MINNVNALYLRAGNIEGILSMSYWRFISILQTAKEESQIKSGKPYVKNKLYQSQKDMIQKTKELNK